MLVLDKIFSRGSHPTPVFSGLYQAFFSSSYKLNPVPDLVNLNPDLKLLS